ncbi:hypothetical protein FNV43_RR11506 [Rhamnella rubrinervis]|uniref:RING-type E3 ubiquitin transferase n=1 Tax=Rhamnella rubrinervis TaxID=2594499 RepID=A0A8K0H5N4_9ROSA|nr:hypothetical protein FNV43_RR11506 [Rhamnella rubrinervis]
MFLLRDFGVSKIGLLAVAVVLWLGKYPLFTILLMLLIGQAGDYSRKVVKRCEKIRDTLDSCLSQIQNLVPVLLAAKISGIIHDLRSAQFPLDSAEYEAGKVVLSLLRQDITASATANAKELEALQLAASKLDIMSPLALLIERRSIKSQLNKINDTDVRKKKILKYLQYLLRKYKESLSQCQNEGTFAQHEGTSSEFIEPELQVEYEEFADTGTPEPPEGFKCPISMRLMYDPVIIASGKTFERIWIERWFDEGNNTCPITHSKLDNLYVTPNSAMKGLISKWCLKHGIIIHDPFSQPFPATHPRPIPSCSSSITSFDSSMNDLRLQVSCVSLYSSDSNRGSDFLDDKGGDGFKNRLVQMNQESHNVHYFARSHGNKLALLPILVELSWECQCRAMEDMKNHLEENDQAYLPMISNDHVALLIRFIKTASELSNAKAQREGVEVLLAILCRNRGEIPPLHEDVIYVLTSYLGSEITGKVLAGMEVLSHEQYYKSVMLTSGSLASILKILETQITEFHTLAMKVLYNLSSHKDIGYHIVYLDYIPKLVQFLRDKTLAPYCIKIMSHLSKNGEARIAVAESIDCFDAIARLLEVGTKEEQEHAVDVLLSLCHGCAEYCQLVNRESIIESLVSISVNGNSRGTVISKELLQLLGRIGITDSTTSECAIANDGLEIPRNSAKKSSSKAFRFLVKNVPIFSKPSS